MGAIDAVPPPPIVCVLSEHRMGTQLKIEANIRAEGARSGTYRLKVVKDGPAGTATVNQRSDFRVDAGASLRLGGLAVSMEPEARYRAVLSVEVGDTTFTCQRSGPEDSTPL